MKEDATSVSRLQLSKQTVEGFISMPLYYFHIFDAMFRKSRSICYRTHRKSDLQGSMLMLQSD